MDKRTELLRVFSMEIRRILVSLKIDFERLQEIHLRINAPIILVYNNEEYFLKQDAKLSKDISNVYIASQREITETLEFISNYSLYAYEDEIRQGFITIQGGHRVGIAGKVVVENGKIKNVKYISFLNIRLCHQIKGCANEVIPYMISKNSYRICHTLIISPPRCGKTTILRDIVRQLSDGRSDFDGATIGVVDERSEIGACYLGVPQNDLGFRTDVLDCCPKSEGMLMLIRSMSPEIIVVDEVGSRDDIEAIEYVINSGCTIIATVHGSSIDDIKTKPILRNLVEQRIFERYIVLNNQGKIGNIKNIFDSQGNQLFVGH